VASAGGLSLFSEGLNPGWILNAFLHHFPLVEGELLLNKVQGVGLC